MSRLAVHRALGAIDTRNVARDPMLRWVILLTPAFGVFLRLGLPPMTSALDARFSFDLAMYYPLVMSFLPLVVAGMIGTVIGFLLLDQRDDQTMTALLVTPLTLSDYLRYRMTVLVGLSVGFSCLTIPLAGLMETTIWQVVVSSIVAAPLAPVYALFLGSFAGNKVQGFALAKIMGIVLLPCIVAYSVTSPWQTLFGVRAALLAAESVLAVRRASCGIRARACGDRARLAGSRAGAARPPVCAGGQAMND